MIVIEFIDLLYISPSAENQHKYVFCCCFFFKYLHSIFTHKVINKQTFVLQVALNNEFGKAQKIITNVLKFP